MSSFAADRRPLRSANQQPLLTEPPTVTEPPTLTQVSVKALPSGDGHVWLREPGRRPLVKRLRQRSRRPGVIEQRFGGQSQDFRINFWLYRRPRGGIVVVAHVILPTALLAIAVVALGAFLLYVFSWQQRH